MPAMHDDEVERVMRRVRRSHKLVRGWSVETGRDHRGKEAVWVLVTLPDDWPAYGARQRLRETIFDRVRAAAPEPAPWVYVSFQAQSEAASA